MICSGLGLKLMKLVIGGPHASRPTCAFLFSLHAIVIKSSLKTSPSLPVLSPQACNSNQKYPKKSYVSCITSYIGNPKVVYFFVWRPTSEFVTQYADKELPYFVSRLTVSIWSYSSLPACCS